MISTPVPGGAARAPLRAARGARAGTQAASIWTHVLLTWVAGLVLLAWSGRLLAEPPDDRATEAPPEPRRKEAEPPPPRIVVVHRRPDSGPPAVVARGRGRRTFGDDPLEERKAPRALRRAIDDLLGDIEGRRDDRRDEGGR